MNELEEYLDRKKRREELFFENLVPSFKSSCDILRNSGYQIDVAYTLKEDEFVATFKQFLFNNIPVLIEASSRTTQSRSNWTYVISKSIIDTCNHYNLFPIFEADGKRDAIIYEYMDKPEPRIACEWEWNSKDVFSDGKEIHKLLASAEKHNLLSTLLFTWVPVNDFDAFIAEVAKSWDKITAQNTSSIHIVLGMYSKKEKLNEVIAIRHLKYEITKGSGFESKRFVLYEDLILKS